MQNRQTGGPLDIEAEPPGLEEIADDGLKSRLPPEVLEDDSLQWWGKGTARRFSGGDKLPMHSADGPRGSDADVREGIPVPLAR